MQPPSALPTDLAWAISALAAVVPSAFLVCVWRGWVRAGARRTRTAFVLFLCAFGAWLALGACLGASGWLRVTEDGFPRFVPFVGGSVVVGVAALARTAAWRGLVGGVPIPWLLAVEGIRVFGFVFLWIGEAGAIPTEFTTPTAVGDMAVGVLSLVVAGAWHRRVTYRGVLVLMATAVGVLDAGNALRHVVATSASAPAFGQPPFVFLFTAAIPLFVVIHVYVVWRVFRGEGPGSPLQNRGTVAPGAAAPEFVGQTKDGGRVRSSELRGAVTWLSFQRYAACPVCNVTVREFERRLDDLAAFGIRLVLVFHSPASVLQRHLGSVPMTVIADPEMALYQLYGVGERGLRGALDPRNLLSGLRSVGRGGITDPTAADCSALVIPSDFLIDPSWIVWHVHHGRYAGDSLRVDEALALVQPWNDER